MLLCGPFIITLLLTSHHQGKYNGGWKLTDFEQRTTGSKCYSGSYSSVGSVATIYTRGSIPLVLEWLRRTSPASSVSAQDRLPERPFDHVFSHLARRGVPIRTAEPNLVIADLDHASETVEGRIDLNKAAKVYKMHRWNDKAAYGLGGAA